MNNSTSGSKTILFVCLGNICRSPMAKAVFDYISSKESNPKNVYRTQSVGTAGYHIGEDADSRTIQVCLQNKVPIQHKAQQIDKIHWLSADMILAMDKENVSNLYKIIPADHQSKIQLIGEFDPISPGKEVPDPYHGSIRDFEHVFDQLYRISKNLLKSLEY